MMRLLILIALGVFGIRSVESGINIFNPLSIHNAIDDSLIKSTQNFQEFVGKPLEDKDVTFHLFKKGSENCTVFTFEDPSVAVNEDGKLYFLLHGWMESNKEKWVSNLTKALLKRDPTAYVIQLDWSGPAKTSNFAFAVYNSEEVGRLLANMVHKLVKRLHQPIEDVTLIGHDLGAQASGFAAKGYKVLTKRSKRIQRIIALDPSGGIFISRPEGRRLNPEDADNVIVLHTDGTWLGFISQCGTLDFFANGGVTQPGCIGFGVSLSCNHWRSWQYFIEAIDDPEAFTAKKCKSYFFGSPTGCVDDEENLGNALTTKKSGNFYFKTHSKPPFSETKKTKSDGVLSKFGL